MLTKKVAIDALATLPDDASWDDIQERIAFVAGVQQGLRQISAGLGIPHATMETEFAEWLTD